MLVNDSFLLMWAPLVVLFFIFYLFFGCTLGMSKIPGQGLNPHCSCELCHCCGNARSLTCYTHWKFQLHYFLDQVQSVKFFCKIIYLWPFILQYKFYFLLKNFFWLLFPQYKFFSTVQHGDPVIHTCIDSFFSHYHAPS